MLTRDWSATPEPYKGIQMRSKIERHVAEFLDELDVRWVYECPVIHEGNRLRYLPDFKIADFYPELGLCDPDEPGANGVGWIEVKPQEFIYALRDHYKVPERSQNAVAIAATAQDLVDANIEELWKPKRLAELVNREVLVLGAVNRDRTLSVRMTPISLVFETDNPVVNHRGVQRSMAKEEARRQRQQEWAARQAERDAEQRQQQAERLETFGYVVRNCARISARYDGTCWWCRKRFESHLLYAYKCDDRWVTICRGCTKTIESET